RNTAGTLQAILAHRDILWNPQMGVYGMLIMPMSLLRITVLPVAVALAGISCILMAVLFPLFGIIFSTILFSIIFFSLFCSRYLVPRAALFAFIVELGMLLGIYDYICRRHISHWERA